MKLTFEQLQNKVENICLNLGLKKIEVPRFYVNFYCIDENNPIWDSEKICPSAIGRIDYQFKTVNVYDEIHPVRGNKIYFDGNKQIIRNSNLYYYKKIIKNTILNYKKFLIDLKLDSLNKDFK
ncbi:MAG: hypothetical protein J6T10_11715 [Methanobrevibacter sp.]|nr:hypothetical protein [Methanobrevibacter sp.]